jgi:hypothetical protein
MEDSCAAFEHPKYGKILRTPHHCFHNLTGYLFKANYIDFRGMRVHYVDEGKENHSKVGLIKYYF